MHVLFVHQNYPAQFGHVAAELARRHGYRCTFVSERPAGTEDGVERVQYQVRGGPGERAHWCGRAFETAVWHESLHAGQLSVTRKALGFPPLMGG